MTIQIQEIEYCKYNVTFLADPELVAKERKEILKELAKEKPKVSGFRPGKAPTHALKQQYSKFIDQRLQQKLVSKGLEDFLAESDLDLVGHPYLSNFSFKDNDFSCGFVVHADPKVELKEYKGFSIPKPQLSSTIEELQESLLFNLRKQYGTKIETNKDSVIIENDLVELDFKIYFEDKLISEKTNLQCDLRNDVKKLPEDAKILFGVLKPELLGMQIGESKTFEYQFTENLPENQKELANKLTKWEVKVNKIDRVELASLDDKLAQTYYKFSGVVHPDEQNLTTLIHELHNQASDQLNKELQKKVQDQVIARLLNNHQVEIPAW
jgi:trigger factor